MLHVRLTMLAPGEGRGVVQSQVPLLEELEDRVKERRVVGRFRRFEELPRGHLIRHPDRSNVPEKEKKKPRKRDNPTRPERMRACVYVEMRARARGLPRENYYYRRAAKMCPFDRSTSIISSCALPSRFSMSRAN